MAQAVYDRILDACLSVVRSLTLDSIDTANIRRRKLPKASETLDTLPLVVISAGDRPSEVWFESFENQIFVRYPVDIVCIAADQNDFESNEDRYLGWRELIRRAFLSPRLDGAPTVYDTTILPNVAWDRQLLNDNYAYCGSSLIFSSCEQR